NPQHGTIPPPPAKRPSATPAGGEPSVLVADLAAAHTAVAHVATAQGTAPATPDLASASRDLAVSEVRHDAAAAFSDAEEAFSRQGHERKSEPNLTGPIETFDDLDEGYQPVGFWDRLRGKRPDK